VKCRFPTPMRPPECVAIVTGLERGRKGRQTASGRGNPKTPARFNNDKPHGLARWYK
jgi:hypothetical protein